MKNLLFLVLFIFPLLVYAGIKEDIYSKLKCCPCPKPSLLECSCPKAEEIKSYVDGLVDAGLKEKDIFLKVAKKFSLTAIIDEEVKREIEKEISVKAPHRPQIYLKDKLFNLGKVKKKGKITLRTFLKNKGGEPLIISGIRSFCACTTAKIIYAGEELLSNKQGEIVLPPQKEGEVFITINLEHPHIKPGRIKRIIEIKTNDPLYPVKEISIEGEIVE